MSCAEASSCGTGSEVIDGSCVPVCVELCGAHQTCKVSVDSARCECVAGYAGDPCEWTGGLLDSQFTNDESWSKTNGAVILPLAQGPSGQGIASFEASVTCSAGAVSQVVEMPSYEDAEPFVVEVDFTFLNVNGVDVGYGRAFRALKQAQLGWNTNRFCLGEAGYGGPVKFQIAAGMPSPDCFTSPGGKMEVARFEILVADEGECAPPASLLNGEANVGEGGWGFDVEWKGMGITTASLEPGVGESGSDGARIYKPAGGEDVGGMFTQLFVPLASSLPSPALRFWWKGSEDWRYYVDLGTFPPLRSHVRPLDELSSDGAPQIATYCLPPWTHGNVVDLSFVLSGGLFGDEAELVVDNVEVVSDPRCGTARDLLDPSFDSAPNRWPGAGMLYTGEPSSSVDVRNDPDLARPPGSGLLELRYARNDARLTAHHWVWVPLSEDNRGPQLVFHSNVPATPGLGVFWTFGVGTRPNSECVDEFCPATPLSEELPLGGGWRRNAVCLPAEWSERWFHVYVAIRPSAEPLELFDPPRAVLLDDFELTTDESCPSGR
jgi:hypothetical protein